MIGNRIAFSNEKKSYLHINLAIICPDMKHMKPAALFITRQITKIKYDRHESTATTELQAPDLAQGHKNLFEIKHFCERLNLL